MGLCVFLLLIIRCVFSVASASISFSWMTVIEKTNVSQNVTIKRNVELWICVQLTIADLFVDFAYF